MNNIDGETLRERSVRESLAMREAIAEFQQAESLSGSATLMKAHLGHAYAVAGKTK